MFSMTYVAKVYDTEYYKNARGDKKWMRIREKSFASGDVLNMW